VLYLTRLALGSLIISARYSENLLDHLKKVGVVSSMIHLYKCKLIRLFLMMMMMIIIIIIISTQQVTSTSSATDAPPKVGDAPSPDGVLTLSKEAKKRVYAPDGILTHHHAIQYLSFGPPFEKPFEKPPIFPSSVAVANRPLARASHTPPVRASPTIHAVPLMEANFPESHETPLVEADFYKEFDVKLGIPQSRVVSPLPTSRSASPAESLASSAKSLHFSTDESTESSQDWDDGTVKMSANLRDGSQRFSLQRIASQCELSLYRKRSYASRWSGKRLKSIRSCLEGLKCSKHVQDEVVETVKSSEEFTTQGSAYSLSFGHDDGSLAGQYLLPLCQIDEEDEISMADMPLLSTSRGFEFNEYAA